MKLGYARVSTEDQRLDLQRARLTEAGCGQLFEEKISSDAQCWSKCCGRCARTMSWS